MADSINPVAGPSVPLTPSQSLNDSALEKITNEIANKNAHEACSDFRFLLRDLSPAAPPEEPFLCTLYNTLYSLIPILNKDLLERLCKDLFHFLELSPSLHKNQIELARTLARWYLQHDDPKKAMRFYGKALKIADKFNSPNIMEIDIEASKLFMEILRGAIQKNDSFTERLKDITRKRDVEGFATVLEEINLLKRYRCTPEDHTLIQDFYRKARDVVLNIMEDSHPLYNSFTTEIREGMLESCPGSFEEPITKRYREKLQEFRLTFREKITGEERFERFKTFFAETFVKDAFALMLESPPCTYDLRAMGSIGQKRISPYSDLEWAILIEKKEAAPYFTRLAWFIEVQALSLGETSDADLIFTALGSKNPSGFHIDSGGNPAAEGLSLVATPAQFAALQGREDLLTSDPQGALRELEHTLLSTSSLATNNADLFVQYKEKAIANLSQPKDNLTIRDHRSHLLLKGRYLSYKEVWTRPYRGGPVDIKTQYIELLGHLTNSLTIQAGHLPSSTTENINTLGEDCFTQETQNLLKQTIQAVESRRHILHLRKKEQYDLLNPTPRQQNILARAYWLLILPLYKKLENISLGKAPFTQFSTIDYDRTKSPLGETSSLLPKAF